MDVQAIIDKYGPTLWQAAQRQVQIDIVSNFFWAAIAATLIAVDYAIALKLWKRHVEEYSDSADDADKIFFWGIASVLPAICVFIVLACVSSAINDLINPVYAAYEHLVPKTAQ